MKRLGEAYTKCLSFALKFTCYELLSIGKSSFQTPDWSKAGVEERGGNVCGREGEGKGNVIKESGIVTIETFSRGILSVRGWRLSANTAYPERELKIRLRGSHLVL